VHLTGLSYQEFSAATGVPVATLRTRVFYALRALRSHLDEGDQTDA
jgi:RNA polymerase sigma-70 factor (ECF subfamily)